MITCKIISSFIKPKYLGVKKQMTLLYKSKVIMINLVFIRTKYMKLVDELIILKVTFVRMNFKYGIKNIKEVDYYLMFM